jgi:hypothetical protein
MELTREKVFDNFENIRKICIIIDAKAGILQKF